MEQTPEYEHTQKGIVQPILVVTALLCLIGGFFMRDRPPYLFICAAAALVCIILAYAMSYLLVRDTGDRLKIRFGPLPLFSKSVPYAEMVSAEKDRSTFLAGWGIHWTRKGWLWNVGGFDCVRIRTDKKSMLIGTDDPDGLVSFLRSRID